VESVDPPDFKGGSLAGATSGSGDLVGIGFVGHFLLVPQGYESGTALSDTATYPATGGGIRAGTYEYTWGNGADQNFTVVINRRVPDTGSTLVLLFLSLTGLFGASRFRSLRLA
jgi:hypothetical protein